MCEGVPRGLLVPLGCLLRRFLSLSSCVERRKTPFPKRCCEASALGELITTLLTFYFAAELKGNKQAQDIKAGVGSLGGLKKSL